jgi:DNA-binding phage protein
MLVQARKGFYFSYDFKDHDPILDSVSTLIEDRGVSHIYISNKSGVSLTTLRKWHYRRVKRPQFATVKAVVKALGGELSITYRGRKI